MARLRPARTVRAHASCAQPAITSPTLGQTPPCTIQRRTALVVRRGSCRRRTALHVRVVRRASTHSTRRRASRVVREKTSASPYRLIHSPPLPLLHPTKPAPNSLIMSPPLPFPPPLVYPQGPAATLRPPKRMNVWLVRLGFRRVGNLPALRRVRHATQGLFQRAWLSIVAAAQRESIAGVATIRGESRRGVKGSEGE